MNYLNFNGKIQPGDHPVLLVSNRGYRYGDGLFETIKVVHEKILLSEYHLERLFSGLELLRFGIPKLFTAEKLTNEIRNLCEKNKCLERARVRLSVFRGNGGLYDEDRALQYVIECWSMDASVNNLNENGLVIDIYRGARKNCDVFSNLKSANFLPYSMAAIHAKENKLNDCLVLNASGHIADSTIANIFLINGGIISTPALTEGCVNGVMRRYLLSHMREAGYEIHETTVATRDIEKANEVFLSNAINGIRWVRQFGETTYPHIQTMKIYDRFIKTVFNPS
jgi:branched-chain amino acid aminotransferase